jgi:hypothetical protein
MAAIGARRNGILCVLVFTFVGGLRAEDPVPPSPARAPAETGPVTRQEHDKVLQEIDSLKKQLEAMRLQPSADFAGEPSETPPGAAQGDATTGKAGVFDKPFLGEGGPKAYLGGYFDVEYRDAQHAAHQTSLHRFVPLIYADIHERIKFASEIEIEDGGEVSVEFAFLDLIIFEQASFRGGAILDPLGKFNLIHDSPINDLTDRPLVDQFVIPTTLREIGVGLFGTLSPPEWAWQVKYEVYLVTGFKGLDNAGTTTFNQQTGIRGGRPSEDGLGTEPFEDNNNAFAGVGRVSVSPLIGTEVGVSAYTGAYDQSDDNNLTILALDGLYTLPQFHVGDFPVGPIEVQGEYGYDIIERDEFARASGVPGDMSGYYVQVNYHFMPAFLTDNLPFLFFAESTFTLVGRWDYVDLDGGRQRRTTVGLNYRPIEATVFKFDYQFNRGSGPAPATADDNAFLFSIASYF